MRLGRKQKTTRKGGGKSETDTPNGSGIGTGSTGDTLANDPPNQELPPIQPRLGHTKRVEKKALIWFNRGIRSPDGATSKLLRIMEAHPELIDA